MKANITITIIFILMYLSACSAERKEGNTINSNLNINISSNSMAKNNIYYYNDKKPDILPNPPCSDWMPMEEPKEGDWLYSFKEEGETFKEYKEQDINRVSKDRNTLYLLQIGIFDEKCKKIIKRLKRFMNIYYQCICTILKPVNIPQKIYNNARKQYNASLILEYIKRYIPDDAIGLLGVISEDMYVESLNFVFGLGSLQERISVFSLYRYFDYNDISDDNISSIVLLRALKTACHEIGHVFSMKHCIFYNCLMNGSNSLDESDRRVIHLCPVCLEKMKWNIGFNIKKRYSELETFFIDNNLYSELSFVKNRLNE